MKKVGDLNPGPYSVTLSLRGGELLDTRGEVFLNGEVKSFKSSSGNVFHSQTKVLKSKKLKSKKKAAIKTKEGGEQRIFLRANK